MKAFLVAVFVCCIAAAIGNSEEHDAKFKESLDECKTETGIDEEATKKAKEGEFDDPKLPEFFFCIFKKMGYQNDAGEYQTDAIKEGFAEKFDEDIGNRLAEECAKESHGSGPENALAMAKCYHENAPQQK